MTELSDYKRIVEKPMIADYEKRINTLCAYISTLEAERDNLRAQLTDAQARESFWLIETGRQTYWDGRHVQEEAFFTSKIEDAVRFARFEDAEIVRCWLLEKTGAHKLRSVEHRFLPEAQDRAPSHA
jgi:hypothetical protein